MKGLPLNPDGAISEVKMATIDPDFGDVKIYPTPALSAIVHLQRVMSLLLQTTRPVTHAGICRS